MNPEQTQKIKAQQIKDMAASEGWKIVEEELTSEAKQLKEDLVVAVLSKSENTISIAAAIDSIQTLLNKILFYKTIK